MVVFLLLVVALLAIWVGRSAARTRRNEGLIAQLSSRLFALEQQLKQRPSSAAEHPPVVPVAAPTPILTAEVPPLPKQPISHTPAVTPPPSPEPPIATPAVSPRKLVTLEETLGTNWLNKLGIIILVIGIALFLAYELTELGPLGKITVGYLVTAVMLGAGIFFERREQWRILARAGIGGGWALLYFTIYAMQHVPAARVLSSEGLDLILLLLAAAGIVLHTLRYNSQVVTGLAFLLAFTTINIGHGNVSSLIAGVILAAGLAVVTLRRQWFEMEAAGIAAAYLNHYLWLRPIIGPMSGHVVSFAGYAASSVLLFSYWIIFRASYVMRAVDEERGERISDFAAILNLTLFLAVMGYQSVHPEFAFQFLLMIGSMELLAGQLPITRRRRAAFIVLTTLGSCLLVIAIPYHYSGGSLSAGWLGEAEVLLLLGVLLREVVFRRLGLMVAFIVWLQMIYGDVARIFFTGVHARHPGLALLFGVAALAFYIDSQWIPRRWPDMVEQAVDRFSFSVLGYLAGVLAFIGLWFAWPGTWTAVAWSLAALILFEVGLKLRFPQLRLQAYAGFTASFLRIFYVNLNATGAAGVFSARVYTVVPLALAFYYVYGRLTSITDDSLVFERNQKIAGWHAFLGMLPLAALLRLEIEADLVVAAWALLGLILVTIAWKTGRRIFLDQGILLAFGVLLRGITHNLYERSYLPAPSGYGGFATLGAAIAFLFVALPLARALRRNKPESTNANAFITFASALDRRPDQVFFFIPFILLSALLAVELPSGMVTLAWGVEAFAVFAAALRMKERSYRLSALGLLLLCVVKIVVRDVWGLAPRDRYLTFIVLGLALLAVSYLYTRYREVLRQYL